MITVHESGRSHGRVGAVLKPLVPRGARVGRPPHWPRRRLIDGIRFRVRTGVPWRDICVEYGPWAGSTTCSAGGSGTDLAADSSVLRRRERRDRLGPECLLHSLPRPSACGRDRRKGQDHGLGGSRGGFTTKLRLAVEQGQKPMSIVVTAGQRGDPPQFEPVREKVRVPRLVRAGHAPASRRNRATFAAAESAAPSRTRPTRPAIAKSSAPAAAGRRTST
ncbi:transposase [Streptomyces sp. IMTB 1903]|uniref:transposase n=1 Tax=Streptomyces sp. IMTB 1903 TaxID=1776680 RepID=UPI003B63D549